MSGSDREWDDERVRRLRDEWAGKSPRPPTVQVPLTVWSRLVHLTGAAIGALETVGHTIRSSGSEEYGTTVADYALDLDTDLSLLLQQLAGD